MSNYSRRGAPLIERIKSSVVIAANDCWNWQKNKNSWGYGYIRVGPKMRQAHRVSYEAFVGPIPSGLTVDHLCRNPGCVNPAHLEPVTIAENLRRGSSASAKNALKTHCANGHEFSDANVYRTPRGSRQCRRCNLSAVVKYKARRAA
jgi:hypothetical protein